MLHQPKIIYTLKDLELRKIWHHLKMWLNAVHCLHTAAFFLYTLITQDHRFTFKGQKSKNKTFSNFVLLSEFQGEKQMSHILGNMEWNQKEQLHPAPKSSDFLKLKPEQILCVLNGWELQKYFFHNSLLT